MQYKGFFQNQLKGFDRENVDVCVYEIDVEVVDEVDVDEVAVVDVVDVVDVLDVADGVEILFSELFVGV